MARRRSNLRQGARWVTNCAQPHVAVRSERRHGYVVAVFRTVVNCRLGYTDGPSAQLSAERGVHTAYLAPEEALAHPCVET